MIIPDIHQNFDFLEFVLEQQSPKEFTKVIFLGDLFDGKGLQYNNISALRKTLGIVSGLIDKLGDRVEILLGNHDVLYYQLQNLNRVNSLSRSLLLDYYGIPDKEKLSLSREESLKDLWSRIQLVTFKQGFLLSHAGITKDNWHDRNSIKDNLITLNGYLNQLMGKDKSLHRIYRAGFSRGGDLARGGPLWLDWNREFKDELGVPQIVGHTVGGDWRKQGRSFCLDAMQQCYAILDSEGVHPKYIN